MSKGRVYQDPQFSYIDGYSGREIKQLTNYLGHLIFFILLIHAGLMIIDPSVYV